MIVSDLLEKMVYFFKVQPECIDGLGLESDISEPITTKMIIPSKSDKPRALGITQNSIELEWTKPEQGAHNVTSYSILYRSVGQSDPLETWREETCTSESQFTVCNLNIETNYIFKLKVRVNCESGESEESETSNPIKN